MHYTTNDHIESLFRFIDTNSSFFNQIKRLNASF